MPRPGAFAANFTPEVLDRFRELCKQQGKQYTKVLQLLAELYLETNGSVLEGRVSMAPEDPDKKKRQVQVESLQNKLLEDLLKRVELLEEVCAAFDLQPRGSAGEHSAAEGARFDVSNKQRLGFSEVQLVQKMIDGVSKIIALEEKLATGQSLVKGTDF